MKNNGMIYHYGYYRRAGRLHLFSYIVLLLLVLFVILTFFFFRSELTAEHFRYLVRNFEWNPHSVATSGDTIYYNGDDDSSLGFVAGGLACVSDTRVFVSDSKSGITLSDYHGFKTPSAVFGDTYMLVYDRTGSSVAVYSAFSRVKTLTYDGTVTGACVSDNGTFAIAVSEREGYYSTVYVYNKQCEQVNKLSKYKYVTALSLTDDGDRLAVAGVYTNEQGLLSSEVLLLEVGKTTAQATHNVTGTSILTLGFTESETLTVLCNDRALFYDKKGREETSFFYQEPPTGYHLGQDGLLLLFSSSDSRQSTLYGYDEKGRVTIEALSLDGRCQSLCEDAEGYYLLTDKALVTFSKSGSGLLATPTDTEGRVLVKADRAVYLASGSVAERLNRK